MEVAAFKSLSSSLPSFSHGGIPKTPTNSHCCYQPIHNLGLKGSIYPLQLNCGIRATHFHRRRSALTPPSASASTSPKSISSQPDASTDIWLLEPIGDGDWRHIGVKVARPGSYEIVSSSVTVGRVPDKADLVIPVATVSGVHARLAKRQGNLYVTDLGSTNGTYVNEKRLNPGEVFQVLPGNKITFGDSNLAIFLVSKIENVGVREEAKEAGGEESAEEERSQDAQQTETAS